MSFPRTSITRTEQWLLGFGSAFAGSLGLRILMRHHMDYFMNHGLVMALVGGFLAAGVWLKMKQLTPEMRACVLGLAIAISGAGGYGCVVHAMCAGVPAAERLAPLTF